MKGCMTTGYVALVIFCVTILCFAVFFMLFSSVKNDVSSFINGEQYTATVTSYTSEDKEDDEGDTQTYYTSYVTFTTKEGYEVTRPKAFSSTGMPVMGETYTIYYDAKNNTLFVWEAMVVIMFVGMIIMGTILLFAFTGLVLFAFGAKMDGYWKACRNLASLFIPFIMIAFDALLVYGLLHKEHPTFVVIILSFFILVLSLAIWGGYISMAIKKGPLKWKRTSAASWSGDWDNEDSGKEENFDENNNTGKFVKIGRANRKQNKKKR